MTADTTHTPIPGNLQGNAWEAGKLKIAGLDSVCDLMRVNVPVVQTRKDKRLKAGPG